uniref:Uncharacterized protein n=1 Tax=Ignisphaera aggregans TaxID=334771 RepID=A0A7J2U2F6_9CREN
MNRGTITSIAIAILSISLIQIADIATSQTVSISSYYIPALAGYTEPLAVFMNSGVLYVVYDNGVNGTTVVRLDTGGVVKTCAFSDYVLIDYIVGGNNTAYAAMTYDDARYDMNSLRIIDVQNCNIIADFPKSRLLTDSGGCVQGHNCYLRYDMYANTLLVVYEYDNTWVNASLVDPVTRTIIKTITLGTYIDTAVYGAYVGPYYYYINSNGTLYVYEKDLDIYRTIYPAPSGTPTYTNLPFQQAAADIAINMNGALLHAIVSGGSTLKYFYWYRTLIMYDHLFTTSTRYSTDADKEPCAFCGVVAYKDVFAVLSGMSDHTIFISNIPIPYVFVFSPSRGIAINTTVIGMAINVDYNLWSSNKIAAFDPPTGYIYIIDASTLATTATTATTETVTTTTTLFHNVTTTVTNTVTTTIFNTTTVTTTQTITNTITTTETTTTTETQTVTTTAAPYPSMSGTWLLLIMLILIVLAIIGIIKMSSKSIATQEMAFVKKK